MPTKKTDQEDLAAGVEAPPVKDEPKAEKTDAEKWAEMYGPDCLPPQRVRQGYAPL